jgi:predicted nuclease with TOPRIM domain
MANEDLQAKQAEMETLRKHNFELEQKLQKLLMEFTQVRTKAQEMLVQKD